MGLLDQVIVGQLRFRHPCDTENRITSGVKGIKVTLLNTPVEGSQALKLRT